MSVRAELKEGWGRVSEMYRTPKRLPQKKMLTEKDTKSAESQFGSVTMNPKRHRKTYKATSLTKVPKPHNFTFERNPPPALI